VSRRTATYRCFVQLAIEGVLSTQSIETLHCEKLLDLVNRVSWGLVCPGVVPLRLALTRVCIFVPNCWIPFEFARPICRCHSRLLSGILFEFETLDLNEPLIISNSRLRKRGRLKRESLLGGI
jgi:hypothetical protein